jgi:hypothetical protein
LEGEYKDAPSPIGPSLKKYGFAYFYVLVYVILAKLFPLDYVQSDEFYANNLLYKCIYLIFAVEARCYQFYFVFSQ